LESGAPSRDPPGCGPERQPGQTISAVDVATVTSMVVTNKAAMQVEKVRITDAVISNLLEGRVGRWASTRPQLRRVLPRCDMTAASFDWTAPVRQNAPEPR